MNEEKRDKRTNPIIGITIGDINGIGPEVIIKAVENNKLFQYVTILVYGHGKALSHYKKLLDREKFSFNQIQSIDQVNPKKLNVINCVDADLTINTGKETKQGGELALAALLKASEDLKNDKIQGIVTAPINKNNIQSEEFKFPGHTEFFTEKFGAKDSLMFLCNEHLKIGVATGHIPLTKIGEHLTKEVILRKGNLMLKSLKKDFGIRKPKVAILGLNPHAGEDGLLGSEEEEIISPAIKELKDAGHLVYGPYPADGFFGNGTYAKFDGILAMYHDQGLIPFKTLAFEDGVNFTAGLSIVRTSPDHGTAYNISGKGIAHEQSMRSAIYMAIDVIKNRNLDV
ncbi:4-hydroxythreonine-4-phosphate dehydrogenase PdxA [Roseivirga misakiensis]|uniref:4-hydroxythreonine-4-phosphate dehydrogenase PdxA n=1 Tax=Roseivirga misakiensis TaxID=1563681 RepID=A0A1E5T1W5_9BACT|nr:4-hydroxythreonine-4-phosphate dehydrogenase PdxA [Roseivirga misakiensis]OEK05349.1 4-hydroxythreonine-4-phosphate dehydrogenase PdxA [Roseivirga misakiensis]